MALRIWPKRTTGGWGIGLTIGIAAMCESLTKIVMVSDSLTTFGDVVADATAEKNAPIHPNWSSLYASNDITDVRPILEIASLKLCSTGREVFMAEVGMAMTDAYALRHQYLIEQQVLVPNGFTSLKDLYNRGKDVLTAAEFNRIKRNANAVRPSSVFLVGGFDPSGVAHLLFQKAKSAYECLDDPGFWAIGSGGPEARGNRH
jgi:hypothetical protein